MSTQRLWSMIAAIFLPLAAGAQTNNPALALSLYDQINVQMTPSVREWTALEARQILLAGAFVDSTITTDIQLYFKGQKVGVPETEALKLVSLVLAARSAQISVNSIQAQIDQWKQSQAHALIVQSDVPNAVGPHRTVSLDTDPDRTVFRSAVPPATAPVVAPPVDTQTGAVLAQRLQRAQAVLAKLADALGIVEQQAPVIIDARMSGLK